jgi:hypothetical protein
MVHYFPDVDLLPFLCYQKKWHDSGEIINIYIFS